MIPLGVITPKPEELALAKLSVEDESALIVKAVEHLVPGDALVTRDRVWLVADWPEVFPGLGQVLVPVRDRDVPDPLEFMRARQVVTWIGAAIHYGQTRCPSCRTWGGRDHQPGSDDCRLLQHDREHKLIADTSPDDL